MINVKTDQEEAILSLKDSIQREWTGAMVSEEPVKDSHSNGSVENANQQVQGMVRTVNICHGQQA